MANGDIAVNEAGFVAVKNTDDFRLGYDRINEVADLAVRRGIRSFSTEAAMANVAGQFTGALAAVPSLNRIYRWNGGTWKIWDSGWSLNTPAMSGLGGAAEANPGWNARQRYRYVAGMLRCAFIFRLVGTGSTGTVKMGLPVAVEQADAQLGYFNDNTFIGRANLIAGSNGRYYDLLPMLHDQVANDVQFYRMNSAQYLDGIGANSLGAGDFVRGVLEYDVP